MMQWLYETCVVWVQGVGPGHCAATEWVRYWIALAE